MKVCCNCLEIKTNRELSASPKTPNLCKECIREYKKFLKDFNLKKCSKCQSLKQKSFFAQSSARPDGLDNFCKKCKCNYFKNKPEDYKKAQIKRLKEWQIENPDRYKKSIKKWGKENPDKLREMEKRTRYKYPDKFRQKNSNNRAIKKHALASWRDTDKINAIYKEACRLQETTGIKHHVDHQIPLCHPLVCGLHVENNLQILTASENTSKGNKFTPWVLSENDSQKP